MHNMGKTITSINYFSSKVQCYTIMFHTLVEKSKVTKILIFNLGVFFQVPPVSFQTPPAFLESPTSFPLPSH